MNKYRCLSFDEKNHRFCLFEDASKNIFFSYWHELKKHNIRYLRAGSVFFADLMPNKRLIHSRGMSISKIVLEDETLDYSSDYISCKSNLTADDLISKLDSNHRETIVFIDCIFEDIELVGRDILSSIVFIDCTFKSNFRLINCNIESSLWAPNCRFQKHFSLKESVIKGNVHLEGADFTGLGGVSFRGVKADNIYLDLGVNGGDDIFWLNEMEVIGVVSIGGNFNSEIQFLSHQDKEEEIKTTPKIGTIVVGKELYEFEKANKTSISGSLKIDSMLIENQVVIEGVNAHELNIIGSTIQSFQCNDLGVERDCIITGNFFSESKLIGFKLTNSSIGRHLKIDTNQLNGNTNLQGTAVSEVTYIENNHFVESSTIDIKRFTTSRLLIHPAESLYRNSKFKFFSPRKFSLLSETDARLLGDQYCSLKHWLADAGRLELEDVAFFHMRNNYHPNKATQFFMGGVFGWGVRLSNIAISSFLMIFAFALAYWLIIPDTKFSIALALSIQSFICSFFGEWTNYEPDGTVANIVTLESFVGVIFITVFIGSYIRKLLR